MTAKERESGTSMIRLPPIWREDDLTFVKLARD